MKPLTKNSIEHQFYVCAVRKPDYLSVIDSNLSLVFIASRVGLLRLKKSFKTQDDFLVEIFDNGFDFWWNLIISLCSSNTRIQCPKTEGFPSVDSGYFNTNRKDGISNYLF